MRLFIALNLPDAERERIFGAIRVLREQGYPVRWVEPRHYHLTLKFLGEVHPQRLEPIEESLRKVAGANAGFDLRLGGVGAFPTIRRPRVLWAGVDPSPALRCLKQDVEWGLADFGFPKETRAFHPHLTLGRVQGEGGAGDFRGLDELAARTVIDVSFPAIRLDLVSSRLSREGPRYEILSSSQLSTGR